MKQSYNLYYLFFVELTHLVQRTKTPSLLKFSLGNYVNQYIGFTAPI